VKREPSFLYVCQGNSPFGPALEREYNHFSAFTTFECGNLSLESSSLRRAENVRPLSDKPPPITGGPQGTVPR